MLDGVVGAREPEVFFDSATPGSSILVAPSDGKITVGIKAGGTYADGASHASIWSYDARDRRIGVTFDPPADMESSVSLQLHDAVGHYAAMTVSLGGSGFNVGYRLTLENDYTNLLNDTKSEVHGLAMRVVEDAGTPGDRKIVYEVADAAGTFHDAFTYAFPDASFDADTTRVRLFVQGSQNGISKAETFLFSPLRATNTAGSAEVACPFPATLTLEDITQEYPATTTDPRCSIDAPAPETIRVCAENTTNAVRCKFAVGRLWDLSNTPARAHIAAAPDHDASLIALPRGVLAPAFEIRLEDATHVSATGQASVPALLPLALIVEAADADHFAFAFQHDNDAKTPIGLPQVGAPNEMGLVLSVSNVAGGTGTSCATFDRLGQ